MTITRHTIAITTDTGANFAAETAPVSGRIMQMRYLPGDTGLILDTGADLDVTLKDSGVVVANFHPGQAAFTKAIRQPTHAADGSASLHAAAGEPVEDYIVVTGEALQVSVADGGTGKEGTLHIWTADD
jgi:hypothetical protein